LGFAGDGEKEREGKETELALHVCSKKRPA